MAGEWFSMPFRLGKIGIGLALSMGSCWITGCAMVHQKDREYLSDPVMQRQIDPLESRIESHDFPRREGSVGGSAGAGGGCGC